MWPFIFVLAMVPLLFFWSDSVTTMFPQLAPYLPAKSAPAAGVTLGAGAASAPAVEGFSHWIETPNDQGYVAWTVSEDGKYRLAVGCHTGETATLQVTQLSGAPLSTPLTINYRYGTLPLETGYYVGNELLGAVAQFNDVYLQTAQGEGLAKFKVEPVQSNAVAHVIQNTCARA